MINYINTVIRNSYISENRRKELEEVSIRKLQLVEMPGPISTSEGVGSIQEEILFHLVLDTGRCNSELPSRVRNRIEYRLERNLKKHFPYLEFSGVLAVETCATYKVIESFI